MTGTELKALAKALETVSSLKEEPDARAIVSAFLHNPYAAPAKATKVQFEELKNTAIDELIKERSIVCDNDAQILSHILLGPSNFPPPKESHFRFIDLFAGIGGFRIAFQQAGGRCVFTSEWNKYAKQTYERNFGEVPFGDITQIPEEHIPDHEVLCAGFPCQPFSLAGVSKKNSLGRKHGFEDPTQGTLFFDVKRIIAAKRPKAFMLENVKNLVSHDKGQTFEIVKRTLRNELGYVMNWRIVKGSNWVPQNRERIFLVGYDPDQITIEEEDIIIPEKPKAGYKYPELADIIQKKVDGYTLGPGTWDTLERHKSHHARAGNGFGYGLHELPIKAGAVTRTISARYHKDGAEVLIEQKGNRPRMLTVEEAMQLQGFDPKKFVFPVSKTQSYKQIGNSVVIPAIAACAHEIGLVLKNQGISAHARRASKQKSL